MKHFRGKKKNPKQTFTHTAIRSTAQSSHLKRTAKEFLTQGLPYFGTTLETKLSPTNIRPQTTDRQTCFTEIGNEQENFLAPYMKGHSLKVSPFQSVWRLLVAEQDKSATRF